MPALCARLPRILDAQPIRARNPLTAPCLMNIIHLTNHIRLVYTKRTMTDSPISPLLVVDDPQQLKAFTDPLRIRVLDILVDRPATNQQIAKALAEPQAKILYHIRFLLECNLIRLIETRIRGGNVEKYYRAVARAFSLRSHSRATYGALGATIEDALQELFASLDRWPTESSGERRKARLSDEQLHSFQQRLLHLVVEFWGDPAAQDAEAPLRAFAAFTYRDPNEER